MAGRNSKKSNSKVIAAVAGTVGIVFVLWLMAGESADPPSPDSTSSLTGARSGKVEYSIMFDAGSSGSRIHVFKFIRPTEDPHNTQLMEEMFEQLKPGLSSYPDDAVKGAASLKPLLDKAMQFIPEENHATTPIALRATAGLRMLPGDSAQSLLNECYTLFQKYPFKLDTQDKAVFIMDGLDEGVYAWVTVNYLLGRLGKDSAETVGIMDLGGGSTQIAFAVDTTTLSAEERSVVTPKLHRMSFSGRSYTLYAHSYLGFGLNSARESIEKMAQEHPCLPAGFETTPKGGQKTSGMAATAADCTAVVSKLIDDSHSTGSHQGWPTSCTDAKIPCGFDGVPQPKPAPNMQFFALSYLYDLADSFKYATESAGQHTTKDMEVSDYKKAADSLCQMSMAELEAAKGTKPGWADMKDEDLFTACIDFTFGHSLLTTGYHRGETETLLMAQSIEVNGKDVETQWCLGAALQAMQ